MIKVYAYDKNTKEYTGVEFAQENPKRKGDYILPANTTSVQVGEYEKGFIPVFENEGWVLRKDLRGQMQINLSTLNFSNIDYIGEIKEGHQLTDKTTYDDFLKNPDAYEVVDGVFKNISNTPKYKNSVRKNEIIKLLNKLDKETLRPLRAKLTGKSTQLDDEKMNNIEIEAQTLRIELKNLEVV